MGRVHHQSHQATDASVIHATMSLVQWNSSEFIVKSWASITEKYHERKKRVELSFGPSSSVLCRWDCVRSIVLSVREKKTRWTDFWEGKTMLCTTRPIKMNSHWIFPIFGWLIHGARREEKWPNFCLRPLFFSLMRWMCVRADGFLRMCIISTLKLAPSLTSWLVVQSRTNRPPSLLLDFFFSSFFFP